MKLRDVRYQVTDGGRSACGYPNEQYDCTVRAVATSTGVEYGKAHDVIKEILGRKDRKGCYGFQSGAPLVVKKLGWEVLRFWDDEHCTVRKFISEHPKGTFILRTSGHAFAVKDCTIFDDHIPRVKRHITHAWKIVPVKEEKKYDPINKWDKFFYKELEEVEA